METTQLTKQALPPLLLLLALSSLFLFGNDRGRFYRDDYSHNWNSSQVLAIAENLSFEHNLRLFNGLRVRTEGAFQYGLYSRFPIGGYALVRMVISPFGDDFSAKIYAARMLMLLLFAAAAALAYLGLRRATGSPWIALAATLSAFSSHYCLYLSDAISNEGTMDLFAVMLVFHGLIVFTQDGRFRQLLVKVGVALLLGWHVYALLLPFIAFGLGAGLWRAGSVAFRLDLPSVRAAAMSLLRSRHLGLGFYALAVGVAILGFNFANEYFAFEGRRPFMSLPSVQSMLWRTGVNSNIVFDWWAFMEQQFYRVGGMSVPYALPGYVNALGERPYAPMGLQGVAIGIAATLIALTGLLFVRNKAPLGALALCGFCWALPMRNSVVFHYHESLFYIGVPMVLLAVALTGVLRWSSNRLVAAIAAAACLIFVHSSFQMSKEGHDAEAAELQEAVASDFEEIRKIGGGKNFFIAASRRVGGRTKLLGARYAADFYLSGSRLLHSGDSLEWIAQRAGANFQAIDFIISPSRVENPSLLTPRNRILFLYDLAGGNDLLYHLYAAEWQVILQGNLVARSDFDLYLSGRELSYIKTPCLAEDVAARFLLHVYPENVLDLPKHRQQWGFDNLDFSWTPDMHRRTLLGNKCMQTVALPDYAIDAVYTGQYTEAGKIWAAWFKADLRRAM